MNILHIAPTPFFADRGCHIRIRNEIEALQSSRMRIVLCTYPLGNDIQGIDIRRTMPIPGYTQLDAGFSPFKFVADILLFFLVLRTAWRERPDILHGHLHEGALIGWAVKWCLFWRRIPLIMDMQGSLHGELVGYGVIGKHGLLSRLVMFVERVICRMPDFFFCSSENSRTLLVQHFGVDQEKVALVIDVVPDAFFHSQQRSAVRNRIGISDEQTVVLYSGSLLPGKGVAHIVDAVQALHRQCPELFFLIVGYPTETLQQQFDALGLSGSVHLTGQVAYGDLAQWLAAADIALDPKEESSGEASGKILHYMAAGLPVVCFDTGNNRLILGDLGYYAEPAAEQFTRAILRAADDCGLQRGKRGQEGQEIIRAQYSFAVLRSLLLRKYHQWSSIWLLAAFLLQQGDTLVGGIGEAAFNAGVFTEMGTRVLCMLA